MEALPEHGSCFVCGKTNPHSIGVVWNREPDGWIETRLAFSIYQQGSSGLVHEGALAAVLVEAMRTAVWQAGYRVTTACLELDYRKPVPIGEEIRVVGRLFAEGIDSVTSRGDIYLSDGTIAVEAHASYALELHIDEEIRGHH